MTAAVFVPDGITEPRPAIVYASGHSAVGFRSETYQTAILNLVQKLSILVIPSNWEGVLLYGFLFFAIIFMPNGFRLPKRRTRFQTETRTLAESETAGGEAKAG